MTVLAVITGASRGIGAGIAAAAEASGAALAVCNRSPSPGRHLAADLAEPAAWTGFARWFDQLVGEVEPEHCIFVHNAATLSPIGFAGEVDPVGYAANVLLNSAAPQVLGNAVVATATRTGTPTTVVQLSSGAGKNPYPGWSSYCAAKAAVDMWVRSVGLEQTERDDLVRVLAIGPGVVATDMQAEIRASAAGAFPEVERFQALHDTGSLADPATVGAGIWELALAGEWANGAVADLRDLG